jgi:hypothetical protein
MRMIEINAKGEQITPPIVRSMMAQIALAFGRKRSENKGIVTHISLRQRAIWENAMISVQYVGESPLRTCSTPTFAGFPIADAPCADDQIAFIDKDGTTVGRIINLATA